MKIRMATASDIDCFMAVVETSILALCREAYTQQQIDALLQQYPGPNLYKKWLTERILIVAENEGGIIGFAQLDPDSASIEAVHVLPAYTHRGIGRRLLNEIENIAAQRGLAKISLDSSLNAERFYAKCGYLRKGSSQFKCNNGIELETVAYEKAMPG